MGVARGAVLAVVALWGGPVGCAHAGQAEWRRPSVPIQEMAWDGVDQVVVRQGRGDVRWVLPGPAPLPLRTFGTPGRPQHTAGLPDGVPATVRELVSAVPYLLGVPLEDRVLDPDSGVWTTTRGLTPFGAEEVAVRGQLVLKVADRRRTDAKGPFETPDEASLRARFTDPEGRRYEVVLKQAIQPGLPGWRTGGGVLRHVLLEAGVGGRSPLEPPAYAQVVAWGIADVRVDGDWVEQDKLVRVVTLSDGEGGGAVETGLLIWPVRATPDGLVHEPLSLPAALPDGTPQPYVHVRFPQSRLVRAAPPSGAQEVW